MNIHIAESRAVYISLSSFILSVIAALFTIDCFAAPIKKSVKSKKSPPQKVVIIEEKPKCSENSLLHGLTPITMSGIFSPLNLNDGAVAIEGDVWDFSEASFFQADSSFIEYDLGSVSPIAAAFIQGDNNDRFIIKTSLDRVSWTEASELTAVSGPGMRSRYNEFKSTDARYIMLSSIGGDRYVSATEFQLFCAKPSIWPPVLPVRIAKPLFIRAEVRDGAGNTFWITLAGLFFSFLVVARLLYLQANKRVNISSAKETIARVISTHFISVDVKVLGLFRIAFGVLLFWDLLQRWNSFDLWYSNAGVLGVRGVLLSSIAHTPFTFLQLFESNFAIQLFFVFTALVYLCFLLGFRMAWIHPLTWLLCLSLQNAAPMVNHSGHMVMRLLLTWTLFLPLGSALSADPDQKKVYAGVTRVRSVVFTLLLIQLCVIYLFNGLHKYALPWRNGSFLSSVLYDSAHVTPIGVWVRELFSDTWLQVLTYASLAVEAVAVFLLLSPFKTALCRIIAVALLVLFHLSIMLTMQLSVFSLAMISFLILMLPSEAVRFSRGKEEKTVPTYLFGTSLLYRSRYVLATLLLIWFTVSSVSRLIRENEPLTSWLPHNRISVLESPLDLMQTYQGWCMFASCTKTSFSGSQEMTIVEGLTEDGVAFDPLRSVVAGRIVTPNDVVDSPYQGVSDEQLSVYLRHLTGSEAALLRPFSDWLKHVKVGVFATGNPDLDVMLSKLVSIRVYQREVRMSAQTKDVPVFIQESYIFKL